MATTPKPSPIENGAGGAAYRGAVNSRLSLAALIFGVLAIPSALLPVVGVVVAAVTLLLCLVALVFAIRGGTRRTFPSVGLVLGIVAMAVSIMITHSAMDLMNQCSGLSGEELKRCLSEKGNRD